MKAIFFLTLLVCGISITGCSQKLHPEDSLSRNNADKVIEQEFIQDIKEHNFIMFSIAEKHFLLIVEKEKEYEEVFFDSETGFKSNKVIHEKPNKLFTKMFDKNLYLHDYITFNSDFFKPNYEVSSGNITYFVFKSPKFGRVAEARLSFFVKPNPIDNEIYIYLTNKSLEYIKSSKKK